MTAESNKKQVQKKTKTPAAQPPASEKQEEGGLEAKLNFFILNVLKPRAGIITISLLAVIIIIIGGYYWFQQRQEAAVEVLSEVSSAEELNELEQLAEKHSGSKAGELATFKVAVKYYKQEEYEKAADYFDALLNQYSDSTFRQQARLGKAYSLEEEDDYQGAVELFAETAEAVDAELESRMEAYYGAGRNAAELGDTDKAIEYYTKALNTDSHGFYYDRIQTALHHLQA
ncbi:MAG: tetratricopeptide repeat protein, partial [Lentisphaeria bacterium]